MSEEKTIEERLDYLLKGLRYIAGQLDGLETKVSRRPSSTNFYSPKGGQIQFAVGSPRWSTPEESGDGRLISRVIKDGALFIEAAPPDPAREGFLDWANRKIIFALSEKDIGACYHAITKREPDRNGCLVNLTHKTGEDVVKYFKIKPGQSGTFLLELADATTKTRVSVFINEQDMARLELVMLSSFSHVLGWDVL